jgi:hypothetical protein
MAKKSKSSSSATASLDSFLDTLFNVAGILVIIIALAQITARETIKDVNTGKKSQGGISAEMLAKKQRELEQITRKRTGKEAQFNNLQSKVARQGKQLREKNNEAKEKKRALNLDGEFIPISNLNALMETAKTRAEDLNATWIDLSNTYTNILAVKDSETILAQLKQATKDRDSNQTALADAEKQSQENQAKLAKAKKDLVTAELAQAIAALKRKLSDSKARQKTNQARLDAWKIQLDDLETRLAQAEFKARPMVVPAPHDPPELPAITFWVRHNRIIASERAVTLKDRWHEREFRPWFKRHEDEIRATFVRGSGKFTFEQVVTFYLQKEWKRGVLAEVKQTMRTADFELDFTDYPNFTNIKWRRKVVGESTKEMLNRDSDFRKTITRAAREEKNWIRFVVFDDSFQSYRLARAVIEKENLTILKDDPAGAKLLEDVAEGKLVLSEVWKEFKGFKLEAGWEPFQSDGGFGFVSSGGRKINPD